MPIILVDCNNFFVSCEQLFDPSLKGKAVCVLSNNDGCVVARSNEAKDLGITMGMPYFMAKRKFKGAIFLSGSIPKYREISKKIMEKLHDFSPTVETYSIDEAFLDISGCQRAHKSDNFTIAKKIKEEIQNSIGISVSVGLAESKTLAKLASEIAKSKIREKNDLTGVFQINEENLETILRKTNINEVWGIGRNHGKALRHHNVRSAWDFVNLPDDFLKRNMGKIGLDMKQELLGTSKNPVAFEIGPPKSISDTASFGEFSNDSGVIKNALNFHSHKVCKKLRRYGLEARSVAIMLRTKDFHVTSTKINPPEPVDSEFEISDLINKMFDQIYVEGVMYRSAGVILTKVEKKKESQLSIFSSEKKIKSKKLSSAWDKIEQKFGFGILKIGITKKNDE